MVGAASGSVDRIRTQPCDFGAMTAATIANTPPAGTSLGGASYGPDANSRRSGASASADWLERNVNICWKR